MTKVYKCLLCGTVVMNKDYTDDDIPVCGLCGFHMTPIQSTVEDAPDKFYEEASKSLFNASKRR